jgi:hypothetical protein
VAAADTAAADNAAGDPVVAAVTQADSADNKVAAKAAAVDMVDKGNGADDPEAGSADKVAALVVAGDPVGVGRLGIGLMVAGRAGRRVDDRADLSLEMIGVMTATAGAKNGFAIPNPISSIRTTLCFWSTSRRASRPEKANRRRLSIWSKSFQAPANG